MPSPITGELHGVDGESAEHIQARQIPHDGFCKQGTSQIVLHYTRNIFHCMVLELLEEPNGERGKIKSSLSDEKFIWLFFIRFSDPPTPSRLKMVNVFCVQKLLSSDLNLKRVLHTPTLPFLSYLFEFIDFIRHCSFEFSPLEV